MPSEFGIPAKSHGPTEPGVALAKDSLNNGLEANGIPQEAKNAEICDRLRRQLYQLSALQQLAGYFATMPKTSQIAKILLEIFCRDLNAKTAVVWFKARNATDYLPMSGLGIEKHTWNDWKLPAPNPFPHLPMLLLQPNWLEKQAILPSMGELLGSQGELEICYVPFEYNSALMGFAIIGITPGFAIAEETDALTILGHQVGASLFNSYLFADLSEQRDELKFKVMELEKANDALQKLDHFKNEFLIITSHELRTPLTGVIGLTKLVLDGLYEDENEMRQMLSDSYMSASYLLKLLNDILDLAKVESGQLKILPRAVSVMDRFAEMKLIANTIPRKPGVVLNWPCGLEMLPEMLADPDRFNQVLINLLSNALKFTHQGYVSILAERDIGFINFSVADTGIGISPDNQGRLFQKFVQADSGCAREFSGSGLGLVISKHLVEMMGGSIALHSDGEGRGTTIKFTVPIA
jgi:signal transduction histidine kinase